MNSNKLNTIFSSRRNVIIGIIVAFVGLNIILLLVTGIIPLPGTQKTSEALLVTVGDQKIYRSTIEKAALEYYTKSAINNDVLKITYDLLIERLLLDIEARKESIVVSGQELEARAKQMTPPSMQTTIPSDIKTAALYALIKEKLLVKYVLSKDAYTITFWIPPASYPQKPEYVIHRSDGKKLLDEAEARFKKSEDPFTVAKDLYARYSSLQNILLFNGYKIKDITDPTKFTAPKNYTFDEQKLTMLDDPEFYNPLRSAKIGEIIKINKSDDSGGALIKIISQTTGKYQSIDQLIAERKKELVIVHNRL